MIRPCFAFLSLLTAFCAALGGPAAQPVQADTIMVMFIPPAIDPALDKPNGPNDMPGWGGIKMMFDKPLTAAKFMIVGGCPQFMPVPDFTAGTDTILIAPGGYRIPVGNKVTVMVTSNEVVKLKPNPAEGPAVNFWRYKSSDTSANNRPATAVIPEPGAIALVALALPALIARARRQRAAG
jgi:hypothetical protein